MFNMDVLLEERESGRIMPNSCAVVQCQLEAVEARGRAMGEAAGRAKALLAILDGRGLRVPADLRDRISACTDIPTLDRWIARALTAQSTTEVIAEGNA